jgi:hypothetical protein
LVNGYFDIQSVIVINGHKTIQEALKKDEFQGRPDFEIWKTRNFDDKNRGILFCDGGKVWQEVWKHRDF